MTELSAGLFEMQPGLNNLLSRYGECMMWLARYMERIENLARLLEVTESCTRAGWPAGMGYHPAN